MDGVSDDLSKLGVKKWWMVTKSRELRNKVLMEAEPEIGCSDYHLLSFIIISIIYYHLL